ncbi:MAG: efflux RND transporter periplasmic adaptor subunit, partial [Calditrichaeota bacterium]|nr:efflux RND transporter periplasmic adaptor subunit [Calditrichota bacterium]
MTGSRIPKIHTMLWRGTGLAVVLALLVLGSGCGRRGGGKQGQGGAATWVRVVPAAVKAIAQTLKHTGQVQAWRVANVGPEIGGRIARIYVQEGDWVKKGQVLAELDTRSMRLQKEQAEAAVAVAKANLETAQRTWERISRLHEQGMVTDQDFEKAELGLKSAKAQLQQAKAALHLAEYQLDVAIMKAPFDGVVTGKWHEEGDVVNPMMGLAGRGSGVLTVVDPTRVKVTVQLPPSEVALVRKGQKAFLEVATKPGTRFYGEVTWVNPGADPGSKTFSAQIVCKNPGLAIKPGVFADVTIVVQEHSQAIVVPRVAVLGDSVVFVVENNVAKERRVRVGLKNKDEVELLDGVRPG